MSLLSGFESPFSESLLFTQVVAIAMIWFQNFGHSLVGARVGHRVHRHLGQADVVRVESCIK